MIPNYSREDAKAICHYLGKILVALGIVLFFPILIGFLAREWNPVLDFFLTSLLCFITGSALLFLFPRAEDINWRQGMVLVALAWLLAMFFSAFPLYLSGHYGCYLDACFESMSAYATTGLVLVHNLDHMPYTHNFWRHFMCFIGGQGIILVALIFFFRGSGAFRVYAGEGRDARILPNIITTSKFIWMVSFTYLIIGTLLLAGVLMIHEVNPVRALFHGVCIFMAGWDTAGFAPQSQNVLYYHSFSFEIITIIIFLLGAISFGVHYAVWTGRFRELRENFEVKVLFSTIVLTYLVTLLGFWNRFSEFPDVFSFFRASFYHVISGHTGVGYSNIYVAELATWSELALLGVILAMGFGGCTNSTSGGIKSLRIGSFWASLRKEVRKFSYPDGSHVQIKYHLQQDLLLDDQQVRTGLLIAVSFILLYLSGAFLGIFLGYGFIPSLFESTSAAGNVGLSVGITRPGMPAILKIWYIIEMWVGRLEFIAIFVMLRFFVKLFKR